MTGSRLYHAGHRFGSPYDGKYVATYDSRSTEYDPGVFNPQLQRYA